MASQAPHDSNLHILRPAGHVDGVKPPPGRYVRGLPPELPVIDLLSETPLPPLDDDAPDRPRHGTPATYPSFPYAPSDERFSSFYGDARDAGPSDVPGDAQSTQLAGGTLWLVGDVLMCGCPDCGAPMTVRLWLMVADCWQCGTSIELTEEQEQEARRLLQRRDAAQSGRSATNGTAVLPPPGREQIASAGVAVPKPSPSASHAASAPSTPRDAPAALPPARPRPAPPALRPAAPRIRRATATRSASARIHDMFKLTPAWLVSLVFHMVLLTLLALFEIPDDQRDRTILLSASVQTPRHEGGEVIIDPSDDVHFDLPLPANVDMSDEPVREAMILADQDARELRVDPDTPNPLRPDLERVKEQIGAPTGVRQALAARDPRVRVELVSQEGGTTLTEAAVARGLRWMARHQNSDGSWSLHAFNRSRECNCDNVGGVVSDSAGTSLVLLPFLGAGQTHLSGRYKDTVARGLRWMLDQQKEDGDLRGNSQGNTGMYAHGQATIVLCEAYAMEGDEALRDAAQKAVDFIVEAQHIEGGWRYSPGQPGDTSVLGWQLMALQSARAAGLTVPPETLELADQYLDSVQHNGGARYAYIRGQNPTHVMTAEAMLCRMYLGWTGNEPGLIEGMSWLGDEHPPSRDDANFYYWYYATQAMHHVGGPEWEKWNLKMRSLLVQLQETAGHEAGSWTPRGAHDPAGGRLYTTALATCTLEVYYRHLPIFRRIDLK